MSLWLSEAEYKEQHNVASLFNQIKIRSLKWILCATQNNNKKDIYLYIIISYACNRILMWPNCHPSIHLSSFLFISLFLILTTICYCCCWYFIIPWLGTWTNNIELKSLGNSRLFIRLASLDLLTCHISYFDTFICFISLEYFKFTIRKCSECVRNSRPTPFDGNISHVMTSIICV